MALAVDIVLSDSSKGGSPLSELPGLAVFWGARGKRGRGRGDKRPPYYLCVKGHTRSKSNSHLCFPHTLMQLSG